MYDYSFKFISIVLHISKDIGIILTMKGLTLGQTDTVGWTDGKKRSVGEKKRKRSLIEITRIYKKNLLSISVRRCIIYKTDVRAVDIGIIFPRLKN